MEWMLILVMGFGSQIETTTMTGFDTEAGCYRAGIKLGETIAQRRLVVAKQLGKEALQEPQARNTVCQQVFTKTAQDPQSPVLSK